MKKMIICNQKMFLTYDEAKKLKNDLDELDLSSINLIISPSYLNMDVFKNYTLCAQNCHYEDKGAYTGEISAYDLELRGIKYCLVGHSERRVYDDLNTINKKVKAILRNSMTPILCIGENRLDLELRRKSEVIKKQIITAFKDVVLEEYNSIIIAYEPFWSVGTGKMLKKEDLEDTILFIKKVLDSINISNYKIVYGGSLDSKNINDIKSDLLDGYLLGSSSVSINEVKDIIKCIK